MAGCDIRVFCSCLWSSSTKSPITLKIVYCIEYPPCQRMGLHNGQIDDNIYLPGWIFSLPEAAVQPLMLYPACMKHAGKPAYLVMFVKVPAHKPVILSRVSVYESRMFFFLGSAIVQSISCRICLLLKVDKMVVVPRFNGLVLF